MEAEELDQIFRTKLASLEEVPGLAWNETSAWTKVKTRMSASWGMGGFILFIGIAFIVLFVYMQFVDKKTVVYKDNLRKSKTRELREGKVGTQTPLVKPSYIPKIPSRKKLPLQEKKDTVLKEGTSLGEHDLNLRRSRLLPSFMLIDPKLDIRRVKIKEFSHLMYLPLLEKNRLGFQMPSQPILTLQIDNTFNLDNAFKLYEILSQQRSNYRYNYKYKPYYYGDFRPLGNHNNTQIYINEYNNKRYEE